MKYIVVVSVILFAAPALAHGSSTGLPQADVTPGTLGYGIMQAQEAIQVFMAPTKEEKAHKRVKFAQKRLSIAKRMAEQNRTEKAREAMQQYDNHLQRAKELSDELPEQERSALEAEINRTTSAQVLQEVLERVPEKARKGIMTAMESVEKVPKVEPGTREHKSSEPDQVTADEVEGFVASGRVLPTNSSGRN